MTKTWPQNAVSLALRSRRVINSLVPAASPTGMKRQLDLEKKGEGNSDITASEIEALGAWFAETDPDMTADAQKSPADVLRDDFSRMERRMNGTPQTGAE